MHYMIGAAWRTRVQCFSPLGGSLGGLNTAWAGCRSLPPAAMRFSSSTTRYAATKGYNRRETRKRPLTSAFHRRMGRIRRKASKKSEAKRLIVLADGTRTRLLTFAFHRRMGRIRKAYQISGAERSFVRPDGTRNTPLRYVNNWRNRRIRHAFKARGAEVDLRTEGKLQMPYVPEERSYPRLGVTMAYQRQRRKVARTLLGFDLLNRPSIRRPPRFSRILVLLRRMTPQLNAEKCMTAVRVVMPETWRFNMGSRKLFYVDSSSGLMARLRVSVDELNPCTILLRGQRDTLTNAVNDIISKCTEAKVYQLGYVGSYGFETKRLWPAIDDSCSKELMRVTYRADETTLERSIWVHGEEKTRWIDIPYEEIAKPPVWTRESLQDYVTTVVNSRLPPHMVLKYYRWTGRHSKLVDSNSLRIKMLFSVMEDESAQKCVTSSTVKMIIAFAARHIGYIAVAEKFLFRAEKWGVLPDIDSFNILLQGYLVRKDISLFYRTLRKMHEHEIAPNAYSWLVLLKLAQRRAERREVALAMKELGFLDELATRRGTAIILANSCAHEAFQQGISLPSFVEEHSKRFGDDEWLTEGVLNDIVAECLRFYEKTDRQKYELEKLLNSRPVGISTINVVLEYAAATTDWLIAEWAIRKIEANRCQANSETYLYLLALARAKHLPATLGVTFFYAIMENRLRTLSRRMMDSVLLAPGAQATGPHGAWTDSHSREHDALKAGAGLGEDGAYTAGGPDRNQDGPSTDGSSSAKARFMAREEGDVCYKRPLGHLGKFSLDPDPLFWRANPPRIFSSSMSSLLEQNPMTPRTSPTNGAQWAILSLYDGYRPEKSLSHAILAAFHGIDEPSHLDHWHARYAHLSVHEAVERDWIPRTLSDSCAVTLKHEAGEQPDVQVRLDQYFYPPDMVDYNWRAPW